MSLGDRFNNLVNRIYERTDYGEPRISVIILRLVFISLAVVFFISFELRIDGSALADWYVVGMPWYAFLIVVLLSGVMLELVALGVKLADAGVITYRKKWK